MPWQLSINSAFGHRMDLVSRGNYTGCMCARFVIGLVTINLRRQVALFNQAFPRHACHKVRRSRLSLKTAARSYCHYGSKTHKPSTRTSRYVTWQHIWHIGTLAYQDACVSTSFRCTMGSSSILLQTLVLHSHVWGLRTGLHCNLSPTTLFHALLWLCSLKATSGFALADTLHGNIVYTAITSLA